MEKFENGQQAITAVEDLVAKYKSAPYLDKAVILKQMEDLEIPEKFTGARKLRDHYTQMTPATAMQRAMSLVQSFGELQEKQYPLPLRKEAESMLAGLPRTEAYAAIRDLLRHYANCGD